jgi:pimeloyl-ACP methyl ester carboxylesterase
MKRLFITIALILCASGGSAQDFTSKWYGRAQVGPQALRITFDLKNTDGAWSGAMQSPDQSPQWIPMSGVAVTGDTLNVQIALLGFSYTGVLDGMTLRGAFTQMGNTFPLNLTRQEISVNRPQEPKPKYPYSVENVTFKNEAAGIALAGTLTAPWSDEPHPVVILVSGSGAQDRDEAIAGHRPFWILADYLTRRGIAVLRCDDRGVGASEGDYASATIDDLASDVRAAIGYIKTRKRFAAARLGIVGHSQGGMVALMLAARNEADFIVTLAGPGVDGKTLLDQQRSALLKASGAPDAYIDDYNRTMNEVVDAVLTLENRDEQRAAVTEILAGTPLESAAETTIAQLASPEIRSFMRFDPATYFPSVDVPVLALNGEKDLQVPAGPNLEAIRAGLSHNPNVTVKSYPELNHLFQHAATGLPAEYGQIEETFSEEVMKELADWIFSL